MVCPVCWEEFSGDVVRPNGCQHLFHWNCLDNWVHERRRVLEPGRIITCPLCRQGDCSVFHRVDDVQLHQQQQQQQRQQQPQQPPRPVQGQFMPPTPVHLTCQVCGRLFANTAMKTFHLQTHSGRLQCGACNASFIYQSGLRRHQRQNNH